ncbi:glycosyltransferase family 2 protein [Niallia taxi]|uniref:glycosyltransferase family 2 protein n=1 Tax=Niallia taxi TaxID=2499688 RepID=UPI003D2D39CE
MSNLISIIIPVFNGQDTIEKCIATIISQSYRNIEVIIINDGSTDNSGAILKKISEQDSRIKVVNKENEGVSVARNNGIEIANGKYLTFVDIDDWLEEGYLWKANQLLNQINADCIYFNYKNFQEKTGDFEIVSDFSTDKLIVGEQIMDELLPFFIGNITHSEIPPMATVWRGIYKTSIVKESIRFNADLRIMEDLIFNLNFLSISHSVYLSNYSGYCYLTNSNSTTNKYIKNMMDNNNLVYENILSIISNTKRSEKVKLSLNFRKNLMIITSIKNEHLNPNQEDSSKNIKKIILNNVFGKMRKIPLKWILYVLGLKMRSVIIMKIVNNLFHFIKVLSRKIKSES